MDKVINPESSTAVILVTIVLLGCVIGGVGYVIGRDSIQPAQARTAAPSAGDAERLAAARKTGYERGFAAGKKAAERQADTGDEPNARDALSAGGFDLDPGSYYIVQVAAGDSGAAQISEYAPLQPGASYKLCDAYGVCRQAP
jgi:hypothetical protein